MKNLCDHMNAEVIAGTVTNVREAVIWIQYTYMYIRMKKNPLVYGISNEERMRDPSLYSKCEWALETAVRRRELVEDTARKLDAVRRGDGQPVPDGPGPRGVALLHQLHDHRDRERAADGQFRFEGDSADHLHEFGRCFCAA